MRQTDHPAISGEGCRLNVLADYYESHSNGLPAFSDGIHPAGGFAKYLILVAMQLAELARGPRFTDSAGPRVPILIVVADGWNREEQTQYKIDDYKQFLPQLLNTRTVGQLKQNYQAFRKFYEAYMPKKGKWAV